MARFLVRQSRSVQAPPDGVEHRQRLEAKIADGHQLLELHPMLFV
jgi:hypothetical protein